MDREREQIYDLMLEYGICCQEAGVTGKGLKDMFDLDRARTSLLFEIDSLIKQRNCWQKGWEALALTSETPLPVPGVGSGAKVSEKGLITDERVGQAL